MKKIISVLLSFFILGSILFANVGSTGWQIFRKFKSAKPESLDSIIYNPSLLSFIENKEILSTVEVGLADDITFGLFYTQPIKIKENKFPILVGFLNYNAGKDTLYFIENGELQERTVTLQNDLLALISLGKKIKEKLSIGFTFKFASSNIAEVKTAYAYALDLVAMSNIRNFSFSVGVKNLGTTTKFLETSEKLPTILWLGLNYKNLFKKNYLYLVGLNLPYILDEDRLIPSVGIEILRNPVSLFLNYRQDFEDKLKEDKFCIGFSLKIKNFNFIYSISPTSYLSYIHRVSLNISL